MEQVSKPDAIELERKLGGELFNMWHESFEVMKTEKIPIEKIGGFLDYLKDAYEGDLNTKLMPVMHSIYTSIFEFNSNLLMPLESFNCN